MTDSTPPMTGLRKNHVSIFEDVAQAVGLMAPTGGLAALIPLVFATAGNGTWFLFLVITLAYLPLTYNLNQFARRTASTGGIYTYMELGLGRTWGLVGGWCYLICCLFSISCVVGIFAHYLQVLTATPATNTGLLLLFAIVPTAAAWWISYRDIRLSTDVTLRLELLSVAAMLVLSFIFLTRHPHLDMAQLTLSGMTAGGTQLALVLAFFSLTGFESVTLLGGEAINPTRNIPRSLLLGYLPVAILYTFMAYVLVDCFQGQTTPLDKADAPFQILAIRSGVPFFAPLMLVAFTVSFFGCAIACMNAGSRMVYAMAREHRFAKVATQVHPRHATPSTALGIITLIATAISAIMLICGMDPMDVYGDTAQVAAFGYITSYILVSVAAPVFLRKRGEMKKRHVVIAALSVILFTIPLVGSLYPAPAGIAAYLPYVFLACLACGSSYSWLLGRKSDVTVVTDDPAIS